jgi:hypothetical protein
VLVGLEDWVGIGTLAASISTVVSVIAVVWQLRMLGRQTHDVAQQTHLLSQQTHDAATQTHLSAQANQAAVRMTLWREMIKIDRFFCDRPELRAFIYGSPENAHGTGSLQSHQIELQKS